MEADWDGQDASGMAYQDRTRARARARVGLRYEAGDALDFGVRLRSGSDLSHQSPHVTLVDFDDNDTGDSDFNLDRWFARVRSGGLWGWAGRNDFPFFKQNELFWDDDATLPGLAGGYDLDLEGGKLAFKAGYFSLPVGMQRSSGNLRAGQIVFSVEPGEVGLTLAGGLFDFDADADDPDAPLLLNGNGARDYAIWSGSLQVRLVAGGRPLALGGDVLHNAQDYDASDPDPFTVENRGERDGWALSASYGGLKEPGQWLAAYYDARLETFAVNASYAQDDWARWGSATEGRLSNVKGHELRFGYAVTGRANVLARLYLVEAITTVEDGRRLRVDFNYEF